jgi:hypothetical protein
MDIPETQAILGTQDKGRKKKIEHKTKQTKKHTQKTETKGHSRSDNPEAQTMFGTQDTER